MHLHLAHLIHLLVQVVADGGTHGGVVSRLSAQSVRQLGPFRAIVAVGHLTVAGGPSTDGAHILLLDRLNRSGGDAVEQFRLIATDQFAADTTHGADSALYFPVVETVIDERVVLATDAAKTLIRESASHLAMVHTVDDQLFAHANDPTCGSVGYAHHLAGILAFGKNTHLVVGADTSGGLFASDRRLVIAFLDQTIIVGTDASHIACAGHLTRKRRAPEQLALRIGANCGGAPPRIYVQMGEYHVLHNPGRTQHPHESGAIVILAHQSQADDLMTIAIEHTVICGGETLACIHGSIIHHTSDRRPIPARYVDVVHQPRIQATLSLVHSLSEREQLLRVRDLAMIEHFLRNIAISLTHALLESIIVVILTGKERCNNTQHQYRKYKSIRFHKPISFHNL